MVQRQEGMVLFEQAYGLRSAVRALRLQCWVLELGGWMVRGQEGLVLHQ
jgi:hypothetical protein